MLVYPRVNEIEITLRCSGPRCLARSQAEVAHGTPVLHPAPLPVSDQRVLFLVCGMAVVPRVTSAGATEVTPAPGMLAYLRD